LGFTSKKNWQKEGYSSLLGNLAYLLEVGRGEPNFPIFGLTEEGGIIPWKLPFGFTGYFPLNFRPLLKLFQE